MKKILLLLLLSVLASIALGSNGKCAHCGKVARQMAFKSKDGHFCSRKCAQARYACSLCGQLPKGRYMVVMGVTGEHKRYCLSCSNEPRCFSCLYPMSKGRRFDDGRFQCDFCSSQALSDGQLESLVRQIRQELGAQLGYDTRHLIKLHLVDKKTLVRVSKMSNAMGCMKVSVKTYKNSKRRRNAQKEWKCDLYLLNQLPPIVAGKVISHELTHDYIYHHAGRGLNQKINEGICEAVSGIWLESRGHHGYVEALKKNPDPIYGAGFREVFPQLKSLGLQGVLRRYRSSFRPF